MKTTSVFGAGATTTLDLQLTSEALELKSIVVTASGAPGKNTEAPATTFVVGVTEIEVGDGIVPIALNAPKAKGAVSLAYRAARAGFNAEARLRITSGFPAESAGFVGTFPCETQTQATLQLTVSNLFDSAYRSFVGVPEIGRFIMARVRYDLF